MSSSASASVHDYDHDHDHDHDAGPSASASADDEKHPQDPMTIDSSSSDQKRINDSTTKGEEEKRIINGEEETEIIESIYNTEDVLAELIHASSKHYEQKETQQQQQKDELVAAKMYPSKTSPRRAESAPRGQSSVTALPTKDISIMASVAADQEKALAKTRMKTSSTKTTRSSDPSTAAAAPIPSTSSLMVQRINPFPLRTAKTLKGGAGGTASSPTRRVECAAAALAKVKTTTKSGAQQRIEKENDGGDDDDDDLSFMEAEISPPPTEGLDRQRAGFVQAKPGAFAVMHPDELYRRQELVGGQAMMDSTLNMMNTPTNLGDAAVTLSSFQRGPADGGVVTVSALDSMHLQLEYETRMHQNAVLAEVRQAPKRNSETIIRNDNDNQRNQSRKAFLLYAFLFGVIFIILGISVSLEGLIRNKNKNNTNNNKEACPPIDASVKTNFKYLQNLFCEISGKDILLEEDGPRYQALDWLANNDTYLVAEDIRNPENIVELTERYALAVLYFSTGGPTLWSEQFDFLSNTSVCSWPPDNETLLYGISCNREGEVTEVHIGK